MLAGVSTAEQLGVGFGQRLSDTQRIHKFVLAPTMLRDCWEVLSRRTACGDTWGAPFETTWPRDGLAWSFLWPLLPLCSKG
jgi:hypothetical protein